VISPAAGQNRPRPVVLVPSQAATKTNPGSGTGLVQALNQSYVAALQSAGLTPLLLPTRGRLPEDLSWVSGLVLPGGADVDPRRFSQEAQPTTEVDLESDQLEFELAKWAMAAEIPVLAICRGMQLLNVALGGSLIQDLPQHKSQSGAESGAVPRDRAVHPLTLDPSSALSRIVGGSTLQVNSLHHQAVDRVATSLRATAWAPDGLVEAVEVPGPTFVLGVQYHPEELAPHDPSARALFEAFATACRGQCWDPGRAQDQERLTGAPASRRSAD